MPIAVVTRLHLKPEARRLSFLWLSVQSWWQARQAEGNIGSRIRQSHANEYWTLTMWRDLTALRSFVSSGPHSKAMPKLSQWCDESSSAHWEINTHELPTWMAARLALGRHGRTHKVSAPSAAQAAGLPLGSRGTV
jgi:heme-degrading monooxygenase HmoA